MGNIENSDHNKLTGLAGNASSGLEGASLITIITVVLNGAKHLDASINSVKNLTYEGIEYIVIDGGSTDESVDIIRKNEPFIDYWVSEPDRGIYDAMNKALNISHGDYILFLGSDDILYDVIHEIVGKFDDKTTSYYGDVMLSKSCKIYGGEFYSLRLFMKNIPHQAIFYSRHVFDKYSFNLKYLVVADYALNLKVLSKKELGFRYIPKVIAKYNEDGISSTVVDHAFSLDKPVLIKKYYSVFYYMIYRLVRFVVKAK